MRNMRAHRRFVAVVTCLATLGVGGAGCTRGTDPAAASRKAFEARAVQVAHAWEASAVAKSWQHSLVMLSPVTRRPDQWPGPSLQTEVDPATYGAISVSFYLLDLPPGQPPAPRTGTVTFSDGTTLAVPLESPARAFHEFVGQGPCHPSATPPAAPTPPSGATADCPRARITSVTLGTRHLMTGRGEADLPMWLFTVPGVPHPIERIAVDPSAYSLATGVGGTENSGADFVSPGFYGSDSLRSADGTALTFRVFSGACDDVVGPLVYEDARTVVVGATVIKATSGACQDSLDGHLMSVKLRAPLGNRIVLDGATGRPLTLFEYNV